ncbi:MAG: ABC transporter ATP-binding protein [Desulfurococcaceae archaeon]
MSVHSLQVDEKSILYVENLKTWFPIRRSIIDVVRRKPRLYIRAVDGVSFDIKEGEVFALAGESGCGKTTTGKAILRLVELTDGKIVYRPSKHLFEEMISTNPSMPVVDKYGGIEISRVPAKYFKPFRTEMQIIFQDPYGSLNPRLTIYEILEEPLVIHEIGSTKDERIELVSKALEMVKLTPPEEFLYRYPHMISGGQRQRVVIARALMLRPRFVVADEPVSMLDVSIRAEILSLMMDLKKQLGLTYLFITHDLALARYIADRLAVMYLGKIVELGDVRRIIENPLHPYTKALISAIPEPDPRNRLKMRDVPIKGEVPSALMIPPGCRFHTRCVALEQAPELTELCTKKEPPLIEVEPGHYTACWLHYKK